ncbi:MAG: peptidylprolyl isomerase [Bacteroidales bacterium]|nr:peptidylprolyl isomerase [Bacteroidales bacterium]
MNKIRLLLIALIVLPFTFLNAHQMNSQTIVILQTSLGDIKIKLYDETPKHKENFIKLVQQGYYNGLLFHRVIPSFMVQAGDPNSRNARPGQPLGDGGPNYTIPAEFNAQYFHKKGAVAAARKGDDINPNKESSGSQFYIVQGRTLTAGQLAGLEKSAKHLPFTPEQLDAYSTQGGTPHLDNAYTVFGEVIEGMEVVDLISAVKTNERNRPFTDVKILKAYISD